jgi:hypothetical protein
VKECSGAAGWSDTQQVKATARGPQRLVGDRRRREAHELPQSANASARPTRNNIAFVVGCLSENTIQDLVADALSADTRARVHSHIDTCATCRALVIALARDTDIEAQVAPRVTDVARPAYSVPTGIVTASAAETATESAAEPVGATLRRYRLEREIGAGAMGVVHAALDPNLGRRIALKVLRGTATVEARDRLLREARAMVRQTHPNVVTVHEVSFGEGSDFVAMELIHLETLAEWLRSSRRTSAAILDAFLAAMRLDSRANKRLPPRRCTRASSASLGASCAQVETAGGSSSTAGSGRCSRPRVRSTTRSTATPSPTRSSAGRAEL